MAIHAGPSSAAIKDRIEEARASTPSGDEANIDKFATLFSPATPRASPVLGPVDAQSTHSTQPVPLRPRPQPRARQSTAGDTDSEFGSFVSVSANEDPLSSFGSFDSNPETSFALPPPLKPSVPSSQAPPREPLSFDPLAQNASLEFFDKFGQDAKRASEKNKKSVLDELLLHEDDPLYWLSSEGTGEPSTQTEVVGSPDSEFGEMIGATSEPGNSAFSTKDLQASLLDLDFEFFTPSVTPIPESHSSDPASSASTSPTRRHSRAATSPSRPVPKRRRSSSLHPPSLAPPVASSPSVIPASPAAASVSFYDSKFDDVSPERSGRPLPPRSASYQTLSSISSRWMSSLLPAATPASSVKQSGSGGALPSLESIFGSLTSSGSSAGSAGGATPETSRRSRSTTPVRQPAPQHSSTRFSGFASSPPVTISHGTPFAPPPQTNHGASPFAPHTFIPPTGAPGFTGEGYDWDKGFSVELERELSEGHGEVPPKAMDAAAGRGTSRPSSSTSHTVDNGSVNPNVIVGGVGELIEKKTGSVLLEGRREMTDPILTVDVADAIRSRLPALSRLPRAWHLIYSLDQHGISLNTLYTRCELPPHAIMGKKPSPGGMGFGAPTNAGALVVVKDAGDAVFGAWMGEGIRTSRGKGYFGSGESFLWRYVNDQLEVFKWTGKNDYVALCEPDYLSFGGGDGQYGLYLDDTLLDGSSARCPTFDNAPLCSPAPQKAGATPFECVGLEVWGVWG
ncbi:hypothetical protein HGRIS_007192 [Hohenbuehelia grisea]|uniref:Oxidation resistance protein 1 n=1 Tax=Hohenbuehelia grisea TaxID=104357 RepID=A0ABR3JBX2_9AGAR